jgi:filamentous hemagglutinin family protein
VRIPIRSFTTVFMLGSGLTGGAFANPTGISVVNGQVTIPVIGSALPIQNRPATILNWQTFSIPSGEATKFAQPSASASLLNRVSGANPAVITGSLHSNNRGVLINPTGALNSGSIMIEGISE